MATELNLTLALYNIGRVPKFWVNRVLRRDFGDRTVTMKQYPGLGRIIASLGVMKKILHGVLRRDISAVPRPLDILAERTFVRAGGRGHGELRRPRVFQPSCPRMRGTRVRVS